MNARGVVRMHHVARRHRMQIANQGPLALKPIPRERPFALDAVQAHGAQITSESKRSTIR